MCSFKVGYGARFWYELSSSSKAAKALANVENIMNLLVHARPPSVLLIFSCWWFSPSLLLSKNIILRYGAFFKYLSDLRIVGTWDLLVYQMHHQIMWFARLVDWNLTSICLSTCPFFDLAMYEMFSKMFLCWKSYHSVQKTVIPIIAFV